MGATNESAWVYLTDTLAVEAIAEVRQVKTMADFTLNVTLNIPESCKEQAKKFIDWQGKEVHLVAVLKDS